MRLTIITPFVAVLSLMHFQRCSAAFEYVKGGNLCAGVDPDNSPMEIRFATCGSVNDVGPYISQTPEEMAVICDVATYHGDPSEISEITPYADGSGGNTVGVRVQDEQIIPGQSGCEYAVSQASIKMADNSDPTGGGFVAVAAYVSTGTANCETAHNRVVIPESPGCFGTCVETEDICIMDSVPGSACTGTKSLAPGSTKFSVILQTDTGYTAPTQCDGAGTTVSNVGVRIKYDYSALGSGASVYFNENSSLTLPNFNSTVTHVTMTAGDREVTIDFANGVTRGTYNTVTGAYTKVDNGQIKVLAKPGLPGSFYIDLLFPISYLNAANMWVAYDPKVVGTGTGDGAMTAAGSIGIIAMCAIVAAVMTA